MKQELVDYVTERVDILATSDTSKQDTKEAASAWKAAFEEGRDLDAATNTLLDFLEGRMLGIDDVIAFAEGPAVELMGEQVAAGMLAGAKARKAEGWKYCICEAHVAAAELLGKFERIEL